MKRDASLTLRRYLPALAVAVTLWCSARAPAAVAYDSFDTPTETIRLPLFQSRIITLNAPAARVSVANPDVADIVVISPTEFYILAKDIGATNLLVWERDSRIRSTRQIEITHDLEDHRLPIERKAEA